MSSCSAYREVSLWPTLITAAVVTLLCVVVHYEALQLIMRTLNRLKKRQHERGIHGQAALRRLARWLLPVTIAVLLAVHLLEITIFGLGTLTLMKLHPESGTLTGAFNGTFADALYYSAAVYTTVGFGDITPQGPIRMLTAIEALVGLVLVTWSASFTFLVMQRVWSPEPTK